MSFHKGLGTAELCPGPLEKVSMELGHELHCAVRARVLFFFKQQLVCSDDVNVLGTLHAM